MKQVLIYSNHYILIARTSTSENLTHGLYQVPGSHAFAPEYDVLSTTLCLRVTGREGSTPSLRIQLLGVEDDVIKDGGDCKDQDDIDTWLYVQEEAVIACNEEKKWFPPFNI